MDCLPRDRPTDYKAVYLALSRKEGSQIGYLDSAKFRNIKAADVVQSAGDFESPASTEWPSGTDLSTLQRSLGSSRVALSGFYARSLGLSGGLCLFGCTFKAIRQYQTAPN